MSTPEETCSNRDVLDAVRDLQEKFTSLDNAIRGDLHEPGIVARMNVVESEIGNLKATDGRMLAIVGGVCSLMTGVVLVVGEWVLGKIG